MTRKRHANVIGSLFDAPAVAAPEIPPAAPLPPPAAPPSPGPDAPPAEPSLAVREVLSLPPVWLAELPLATTLEFAALDGTRWYATTGQATYAELRAAGELVFTGAELGAMAVAAENGRASPLALAVWLSAKQAEPSVRLNIAGALDGLQDVTPPAANPAARWPLVRVLWAMAARLVGVSVGDGALREGL